MSLNDEIDEYHLIERIGKAVDSMFEIYSWEQMIDDCDLTPEEKEYAKQNLSYKVVNFNSEYERKKL